jgi:hypothetical protein
LLEVRCKVAGSQRWGERIFFSLLKKENEKLVGGGWGGAGEEERSFVAVPERSWS